MCLNLPFLEKRTLAQGEHRGFEFHITHNGMGNRCGHVRVLPGHPWFGKPFREIGAEAPGDLTFAEPGSACVTHGPEAEWWIGFDCAHAFDGRDRSLPILEEFGGGKELEEILDRLESRKDAALREFFPLHVWTQEEVLEACHSLAEQAAEASA